MGRRWESPDHSPSPAPDPTPHSPRSSPCPPPSNPPRATSPICARSSPPPSEVGLADHPAYQADLAEEMAWAEAAYVTAAVTEIASLRAQLSGPQVG